MKCCFAQHGIPRIIISDNGPQFACDELKEFASMYEFTPTYSSPMYPKSNGQTERCIQTVKSMLKKATLDGSDFHLALLNYRNATIFFLSGRVPSRITNEQKIKMHHSASYLRLFGMTMRVCHRTMFPHSCQLLVDCFEWQAAF